MRRSLFFNSPQSVSVWRSFVAKTLTLVCVFGWLNGFNAELSPKRYLRGPISQEVGEEGDYT